MLGTLCFYLSATSHLLTVLIKTVIPTWSTRALELLVLMKCLWVQLGAQRPDGIWKGDGALWFSVRQVQKSSVFSYLAISAADLASRRGTNPL